MLLKSLTILSLSSFIFVGLSGAAFAQDVSIGETQYQENCAVCHGKKGNGDGPFAKALRADVPALTMLSKNNGGVFPFERVYQTIDGREDVKSHGPREMPIWGKKFIAESDERHGYIFGEWLHEEIAKTRILALIDYIHSLQVK